MGAYTDYVIDMSAAGPGAGVGALSTPSLEVPIAGDFLAVWGESGPGGFGAGYVDVRLNSKTNAVIRMRFGQKIGTYRPTPFDRFFIDWPLLAGQTLGLLIGRDCYVLGEGGPWSGLIGASIPPSMPGGLGIGGALDTIAIANPALGVAWTYTATRKMLVWGIKFVIDTSAVVGVRSVGLAVKRAGLYTQAQAQSDTVAANEVSWYLYGGRNSSTASDSAISNFTGNNLLAVPYTNAFITRMFGVGPEGSYYMDTGDILSFDPAAAQPLLAGDQLQDILLTVQYL